MKKQIGILLLMLPAGMAVASPEPTRSQYKAGNVEEYNVVYVEGSRNLDVNGESSFYFDTALCEGPNDSRCPRAVAPRPGSQHPGQWVQPR